jgi:ligand-binding SRPBCC domain-containing protein
MKTYSLKRQQLVNIPIDEVFGFFQKPENLARLTPDSLDFKILTPLPIEMKAGALIDYTIRLLSFRVRWTTMIVDYDPPHRFVDIQLKGPYSYWHHIHTFSEVSGGTLIEDEVTYLLPFGIPGRLAHGFFIKRKLERIFDYRAELIKKIFG